MTDFKTFKIQFRSKADFDKALEMNHLAHDIGHSDMTLVYDNEFFRDRFVGFLIHEGMIVCTIDDEDDDRRIFHCSLDPIDPIKRPISVPNKPAQWGTS
jgi:hypothetical protein